MLFLRVSAELKKISKTSKRFILESVDHFSSFEFNQEQQSPRGRVQDANRTCLDAAKTPWLGWKTCLDKMQLSLVQCRQGWEERRQWVELCEHACMCDRVIVGRCCFVYTLHTGLFARPSGSVEVMLLISPIWWRRNAEILISICVGLFSVNAHCIFKLRQPAKSSYVIQDGQRKSDNPSDRESIDHWCVSVTLSMKPLFLSGWFSWDG